ncbi:MAG: hypothetical protein ACWA5P_05680 [bacterium]
MKKFIANIILIVAVHFAAVGQYKIKSSADIDWYQNIAQEKIEIVTNTESFLVGEELLYTMHCFNALSNRYSKNSKIAYISLLGKNGEVFRHKVKLKDGLANGYFLLPADLKTGNYQLIGYTRWMLNGGLDQVFQKTIAVINPYEPIKFTDSSSNDMMQTNEIDSSQGQLWLALENQKFSSREEVSFEINTKGTGVYGTYALSVRKIDELSGINSGTLIEVKPKTNSLTRNIGEVIYLPEYQGEMVTGVVIDNETKEPASNVQVMLSILSNEAFQAASTTNDQGVFYIHLKKDFSDTQSMVQVLGENRSNYSIKINEQPNYSNASLGIPSLTLDQNLEKVIVQRSIDNQIANAYREVAPSSLNLPKYPLPFYGNYEYKFVLDDYKRFKTVAETLIEIVEHAWHERKGGKQRFVNVREREFDPYYGVDLLPMLIVDGALVQDHDLVMSLDADLVESISVFREEYYYEDIVYQGALWVQTFEKDYYKYLNGSDFITLFERDAPQLKTAIFKPNYEEEDRSRIPDLRHQLLWEPNLELKGQKEKISFYTSDKKGTFQIKLNGYTKTGKPIVLTKNITVE